MKIEKIPLFEWDGTSSEMILPERSSERYPKKALLAFLGDIIDEQAEENNWDTIFTFDSLTRDLPFYKVKYREEEILVVRAPVGAPMAVSVMEYLIYGGCRQILSTGTCGTLVPREEAEFLVVEKALRDEGTSYHYLPPSRWIHLDSSIVQEIKRSLCRQGHTYETTNVWTTDAYLRETKDKVLLRRNEGCDSVDMEVSALAACAQFRKIEYGALLFTADSLENIEQHDPKNWGHPGFQKALRTALDVLVDMDSQ